jgi:hypothetical protein
MSMRQKRFFTKIGSCGLHPCCNQNKLVGLDVLRVPLEVNSLVCYKKLTQRSAENTTKRRVDTAAAEFSHLASLAHVVTG